VATAAMGVVVWLLVADGSPLELASWSPLLKIGVGVPAGCIAMVVASMILRIPEIRQLLHRERAATVPPAV